MLSTDAAKERRQQQEKRRRQAEDLLYKADPSGVLIAIARAFNARMACAGKATFSPGDCAVDDMIEQIARWPGLWHILSSREVRAAWFHACGTEAK